MYRASAKRIKNKKDYLNDFGLSIRTSKTNIKL
jgi:hypothetical protein